MRKLIFSGSRFEANIGYSRAVVDGEWVFVSGTSGFDYATMTMSLDVVEQTEQTRLWHYVAMVCGTICGQSKDLP